MHKCMSRKYEPASEPLGNEMYRTIESYKYEQIICLVIFVELKGVNQNARRWDVCRTARISR